MDGYGLVETGDMYSFSTILILELSMEATDVDVVMRGTTGGVELV